MASTRIRTLAAMRTYVKLMMGDPVICIEMTDAQLDQIICDAVQIYQEEVAGEGHYQDYLAFPISAGVSAYSTSAFGDFEAVVETDLSFDDPDGINVLFSQTHQLLYEDWVIHGGYPGGPGGHSSRYSGMVLAGYEIAVEYLEDIRDMFARVFHGQYSTAREEIRIIPTPETSGTALLTVYRRETAENLYNNRWVKELSVAKAKILWGGYNIGKYSAPLPNGATINWAEIKADGKEELDKILEEIRLRSEPPLFWIE